MQTTKYLVIFALLTGLAASPSGFMRPAFAQPATATTSPDITALQQQDQLQSGAGTTPAAASAAVPAATTAGTSATPGQAVGLATTQNAGQQNNSQQNSGQPAVVLNPVAATGQADATPALPSLSSILQKTGITNGGTDQQQAAGGQEVAPNQALPPGFDLPVNQNLPEPAQTDEERALETRAAAFNGASQGLMPMKPDEIRKVLELYDETQQAVQTPIYPHPDPQSTFQTISLDPGQPPIEIKTAVGNVTTVSIVDASGQPWPIQDISWAGNFEVLQPESGSNMLRITPVADFAFGNVSMRLVGLNPPVIITLRTDRKAVQVRADIQIPEMGPNGVSPPIQQQITTQAGDSKLATILEGVPPASANRLKVEGIDGRTTAYDLSGTTYVRTPYTLLSPAWDSSVRSADGTNVYAMKFTPVLLLSDKGKMVRAQLSKVDTSDE